jgi:hypothetical protein
MLPKRLPPRVPRVPRDELSAGSNLQACPDRIRPEAETSSHQKQMQHQKLHLAKSWVPNLIYVLGRRPDVNLPNSRAPAVSGDLEAEAL